MTQQQKTNLLEAIKLVMLLLTLLASGIAAYEVGSLGDIQEQGTATIFTDLQVGDGSASAPSYSFSGDTDNGLYRVGTNNVGLAAGGSVILDVDGTDINANSLPVVNIGNSGTDFNSSGGLTLASGLTLSDGNLVVADFIRASVQTTITVSATDTFTPTGSFQIITASAWASPTLSVDTTSFPSGTVLILVNGGSSNIYLADSGNYLLTAAFTMAQNDSITLVKRLGTWVELARANN